VLREHPGLLEKEVLVRMLAPTRLYHDVVAGLKSAGVKPRAMAHITGGGLPENLERLLRDCGADLVIPPWHAPGVTAVLEHVDREDRFHTFNMGVGWVAIVAPEQVPAALEAGPGGFEIGRIVPQTGVRVRIQCD
jgi:phosphoribosylformylglycinamidine cyclo-ligase